MDDSAAAPLAQQLRFLREIDRLKSVVRQSPLLDRSRKENSAEHSWHLAMYASVLGEYASDAIDTARVVQMLLLHDIVEVDVGDTPVHGAGAFREQQAQLEGKAAARLFGLLPAEQGPRFLALWSEFEAGESADARFAKALDRFQPLLVNIFTGGGTWTESAVSMEQVVSRYGPAIRSGAPRLWALCEQWISEHFATDASTADDRMELDRKAVYDLDVEYQAAVGRNDVDTIARIHHDKMVLVLSNGTVITGADLEKDARDKTRVYERQIVVDDSRVVRVTGDTAVVTAKLWLKGTRVSNNEAFDYKLWFSDTYVRTPEGWKYFFGQAGAPPPKT